MKTAILDMDDTLADMRSIVCRELNVRYDKDLHWTRWNDFRVENLYGISFDDFFSYLIENKVLERMNPHAETATFVKNLLDSDYKVTILTARKWHPNARSVTEKWLKKHSLKVHDLVICDVLDDKSKIVNDAYNKVDFVVDDSLSHCKSYVNCDNINKVFVYDMPWNRCQNLDATRAIRIKDLNDILEK